MSNKVAAIITEKIMSKLDQGIIPWHKPWRVSTDMPRNLISNKNYRGVNVFLLLAEGFTSPYWLSMKQTNELGGKVKAKSTPAQIIFWNWKPVTDLDAKGKAEFKIIPFIRYYNVFNLDQVEGINTEKLKHFHELSKLDKEELEFNPIEAAENIVMSYGGCPEINHGGGRAFYNSGTDKIGMPEKKTFKSEHEYYCTLFHEMGHSTGHKNRLDRKSLVDNNSFGSHGYSKEELVAELTASFLSAQSEILTDGILDNSTAYIQSWLKVLKNDKNIFLTAAQSAQKAFDHILGVTVKDKEPAEELVEA
jgi:antirestriction protein ArdC